MRRPSCEKNAIFKSEYIEIGIYFIFELQKKKKLQNRTQGWNRRINKHGKKQTNKRNERKKISGKIRGGSGYTVTTRLFITHTFAFFFFFNSFKLSTKCLSSGCDPFPFSFFFFLNLQKSFDSHDTKFRRRKRNNIRTRIHKKPNFSRPSGRFTTAKCCVVNLFYFFKF